MIARPDQWKHLPFGDVVEIPYRAKFDASQYERLRHSLVPRVMEDKWFVYLEDPHLCFHRSWTGQAVYRVALQRSGDGCTVAGAWCASEMLRNSDPVYQAELLHFLIRNLLLGEAGPFPRPASFPEQPPGVYQHAVSGTGHLENTVADKRWWKFWR